jgi:hypothetical protein
MRDLALEAYNKLEVGQTGWMRPDQGSGETLEGFQSVANAANIMERDGLIQIRLIHNESTSGRSLIDAIQFKKLR